MGIHWQPDLATARPLRAHELADHVPDLWRLAPATPPRSLAHKFPGVPKLAWADERRAFRLWSIALLWSASGLIGGAIGTGIIR